MLYSTQHTNMTAPIINEEIRELIGNNFEHCVRSFAKFTVIGT
jgi:hypothetical protein